MSLTTPLGFSKDQRRIRLQDAASVSAASCLVTMAHFRRNSRVNVLPLGSDFPIEGINPLLGFYAAVSRLSVDGDSPHGPGGW